MINLRRYATAMGLFPRVIPEVGTDAGRAFARHRAITLTAGASILSRAIGIGVTVISVPLTLSYLGPERFGMWMTLSAFSMLLSFTDLGVGNSVLTAVANRSGASNGAELRRQISSAYAVTTGIAAFLLTIFLIVHGLVPWASLFNVTTPVAISEAVTASAVFFVILAITAPLGLVYRVQLGLQQGFRSSIWQSVGNIAALAAIITATRVEASLPWLVAAQAGTPIFIALLNSAHFYLRVRPDLSPKISEIHRLSAFHLSKNGCLFLVLQVCAAILFQSNAIIVAQLVNAESVATYSVAERLFGIVGVLLSLLLMPLWPAYGEAVSSRDLRWVRCTFRRSVLVSLVLALLLSSLFVALGPTLIHWWVGDIVLVPFTLILGLGVWKVMEAVGNSMAMLLNGLNEIGVQALLAVLSAVVSIGMKIWMVDRFGLAGVILATIVTYSLFALPWLGWMVKIALQRIEKRQRLESEKSA